MVSCVDGGAVGMVNLVVALRGPEGVEALGDMSEGWSVCSVCMAVHSTRMREMVWNRGRVCLL